MAMTPGTASASTARDPLCRGITSMAVEGADVVILSETVPDVPDPLRAPKTHEASLGNPLQENLKELLSNPERDSEVVPADPDDFTETVVGFAVIFGVAGAVVGSDFVPGLTPTQSVMVWTRLPLVAKMVTGTVSYVAFE